MTANPRPVPKRRTREAAIPEPAWAYIGPGSGLSAVGAAFALVASVVVAVALTLASCTGASSPSA